MNKLNQLPQIRIARIPAMNLIWPFRDVILRRLLRNASVLLFGQATASALNVAAVAVTARALGPDGFGLLATIHAYAMTWDRLANFQSFEVLIKFGADCLQRADIDRFKALVKLSFILDVLSAAIGTLLAVFALDYIGGWLGWSPASVEMATLYCLVILFNISGMPLGLLRLLDHYVPLSVYQNITALLRLIGVSSIWIMAGSLRDYLLVWMAAEFAGKAYLVATAWIALHNGGYHGVLRSQSLALLKAIPQVPIFAITSHLMSSVRLGTRELDTIIVAGMLGTSSAGMYKLAKHFASILEKATEPIYSTVFPEFSRLVAAKKHRDFIRLMRQTAGIAGSAGLAGWLVFVIFGKQLLWLIAGPDFMASYGVLVGYALATAIATMLTPLQPAILSLGRAHVSLTILLISTITYWVALVLLIRRFELEGAGVAYVVFYLVWGSMIISAIWLWWVRRGMEDAR